MKYVAAFFLCLFLATPVFAQQGNAIGPNAPCSAFGTITGTCLQGNGNAATATTTNQINGVDQTTAWAAYTPTVVCGQSTGTAVCTATGLSKRIGATMMVTVTITVSGTFTVGTITSVSLPSTAQASGTYILAGRETGVSGLVWVGQISSSGTTAGVNNYLSSNTIITGTIVNLSGAYATQ